MKKVLILFFINIIYSQQPIIDIDFERMSEILERDSTILIDVRSPDEYNSFRIKSSINIDYYNPAFLDSISSYKAKKNIIFYCRSGRRSYYAAKLIQQKGFNMIYNLKGGVLEVKKKNLEFKSLNN
ncbi:MAG: rhodanese-like domain-containing protein [Cryomorphaceae bacterium]|nr:MAG: rhodanese-like domain-containing protein [Cryomorphaceae bacterium]